MRPFLPRPGLRSAAGISSTSPAGTENVLCDAQMMIFHMQRLSMNDNIMKHTCIKTRAVMRAGSAVTAAGIHGRTAARGKGTMTHEA